LQHLFHLAASDLLMLKTASSNIQHLLGSCMRFAHRDEAPDPSDQHQ
jgi:hypothetical protein